MAYLLKEADFWQETLYVDERCLIPRPETKMLVEAVKQQVTVTCLLNFNNPKRPL